MTNTDKHEKALTKELEERDYWHDKATELANRIGEHFGIDVGEHSNLNCPVQTALDADWPDRAAVQGEADTLAAICDLLGIGHKSRNHRVIMTCISNIHRFSKMLHAVEHRFFMVPGETDEDYTSEERGEECLVNSWGSSEEQYLEQFERALEVIRRPAPSSESPEREGGA